MGTVKTALLVDFDNIYSGLKKFETVNDAAQFANHPCLWLDWLVKSLPYPSGFQNRRILMRRCYMNPAVYSSFRKPFVIAGFDVIECPPMTAIGKTSTDIHLVVDAMELLRNHEVHYDEVILFSADADFAPVLRKLRQNDRRTAILAFGHPASTYTLCADQVIENDAFLSACQAQEPSPLDEQPETAIDAAANHTSAEICLMPEQVIAIPHNPIERSLHPDNTVNLIEIRPAHKNSDKEKSHVEQLVLDLVKTANEPVTLSAVAAHLSANIPGIENGWHGMGFKKFIRSLNLDQIQVHWSRYGATFSPLDTQDNLSPERISM